MWRARLVGFACSLLALAIPLVGAGTGSARPADAGRAHEAVGGELIVRFSPSVTRAERTRILERHVSSRRALRLRNFELVKLSGDGAQAAAALAQEPGVVAVEPNLVYRVFVEPDDTLFDSLWGLDAAGDHDIDAPEAWDLATGSTSVAAAVVDTGVMSTHADLAANIWSNPGESANGADDDGNGLVDDLRGWDFVFNDNDADDTNGHGTHVAGTIGARGNNALGVTGVNWRVSLMPLRVGEGGSLSTAAIVNAFQYACAKGAKVVNGSFGGSGYSSAMATAVSSCPNTLFVFAAGNGGSDGIGDNVDAGSPIYPCAFPYANVVCVAASDEADGIAGFSNYGATSVDLAAPGTNTLSTYNTGGYATASGTSMAAPHVAGAAALLWSIAPSATPTAVKYSLMKTVDALGAFAGKTVTGGRLNLRATLAAPVEEPPAGWQPGPPPPPPDTVPPSDPAPVSTSHSTGVGSTKLVVAVTWSGAADYGSGVDGYSFHWDSSATSLPDTTKDAEETVTSATSTTLRAGASYWFHLRTRDNAGNWSAGVHVGPYVILGGVNGFCLVPRVVGRTLAAAKTLLRRSRCAPGAIARRRSRVRAGRVIAQRPPARTRLLAGAKVSLTVSRGRR